jgi:hypothetical protein
MAAGFKYFHWLIKSNKDFLLVIVLFKKNDDSLSIKEYENIGRRNS